MPPQVTVADLLLSNASLTPITVEQVFDFAVDDLVRGLEEFIRGRTTKR